MKRIYFYLIGLLTMLLVVSCAKDKENLNGTISGLVSDYSNANTPIAGATVTLNNKGLTKTTGSDGRFEFANIEPGTYTIQAQADNFQSTTKQITVYAGQKVQCDFQMEKGTQSKSISIEPQNLVIGGSMEQTSFVISNNLNHSVDITISNLPDFVVASRSQITINAKGRVSVTLTAVSRQSITIQRSGQFTVSVGDDSYAVNIVVEPFQTEQLDVTVNPTTLNFDSNTSQKTFTIKNNNTYSNYYSISSDLDVLTISPKTGTMSKGATQTITVKINNRQGITSALNGRLLIDFGGSTRAVLINIDKFDDSTSEDISVTRGLQIFYSFNDNTANNAYLPSNNGTLMGEVKPTFISDTPNGSGKALFIGSEQYVNIAKNIFEGKTAFSIGMWVKDFGTGPLFSTIGSSINTPSLEVTSDCKLNVYYSYSSRKTMKTSLLDYQSSGWHHIVITAKQNDVIVLYVDGNRIDSESVGSIVSTGNKMQIGGKVDYSAWADPIKVDNLRLHTVALSDSEVLQIYNSEK